nr:MAG TPA: hypothetical protein [Caudoviricetes sp.]
MKTGQASLLNSYFREMVIFIILLFWRSQYCL